VGLIIEEVSGVECKVPAVENTIECQTDLLIVECAGRFLLGGRAMLRAKKSLPGTAVLL